MSLSTLYYGGSDDHDSNSQPVPTVCDCQNQLGHYDWNGDLHKDLPDLCKKTIGLSAEESQKNGK